MTLDSLMSQSANHALQIAVLAIVVGLVNRLIAKDRPHIAHALWALVLLKCLTPPILPSPMSPFSWLASATQQSALDSTLTEPTAAKTAHISYRFYATDSALPTSGQPPLRERSTVQDAAPKSKSLAYWLGVFWIAGTVCITAWFGVRFVRFILLVRRKSCLVPEDIQAATNELRQTLGIYRQVRVRVLDALIGPAVMGIFRPTLLLPKAIVDRSSISDLRPLIAHELVHIRRGDLLWSALQTLSSMLWWFHPGVWTASRLLTRESERSCDEETIMSLRITPGNYARCLINVLETKKQLTAAPLVPGLRPIDITLSRMERIMRIGHGSHSRTPRLAFATLIVGSLVALPGAAWLSAQETQRANQSLAKQPAPRPWKPIAASPATPAPEALRLPEPEVNVADYLVVDILFMKVPKSEAEKINGLNVVAASPAQVVLAGTVKSDLGTTGQVVLSSGEGKLKASSLSIETSNTAVPLDKETLSTINQWRQSPEQFGVKIVCNPQIATKSGQASSIRVGSQIPYTAAVDSKTMQPTVAVVETGLTLELEATLSNDRPSVHLDCNYKNSTLIAMDDVKKAKVGEQNTITVQSPRVRTHSLDFNLDVALGQPAACISTSYDGDDEEYATVLVANVNEMTAQSATEKTGASQDDFDAEDLAKAKKLPVTSARYERISILGPTTTKDNANLASPSDDECMQAFGKRLQDKDEAKWMRKAKHRIIKHKIADYVDPVRFVPLIGNARQHHVHYKCVIYSKHEDKVVANVIYIDHNHFIMVGGEHHEAEGDEVPAEASSLQSAIEKAHDRQNTPFWQAPLNNSANQDNQLVQHIEVRGFGDRDDISTASFGIERMLAPSPSRLILRQVQTRSPTATHNQQPRDRHDAANHLRGHEFFVPL